jgi:hypothetical protein
LRRPYRALQSHNHRVPRALPWAIVQCPYRAEDRRQPLDTDRPGARVGVAVCATAVSAVRARSELSCGGRRRPGFASARLGMGVTPRPGGRGVASAADGHFQRHFSRRQRPLSLPAPPRSYVARGVPTEPFHIDPNPFRNTLVRVTLEHSFNPNVRPCDFDASNADTPTSFLRTWRSWRRQRPTSTVLMIRNGCAIGPGGCTTSRHVERKHSCENAKKGRKGCHAGRTLTDSNQFQNAFPQDPQLSFAINSHAPLADASGYPTPAVPSPSSPDPAR